MGCSKQKYPSYYAAREDTDGTNHVEYCIECNSYHLIKDSKEKNELRTR